MIFQVRISILKLLQDIILKVTKQFTSTSSFSRRDILNFSSSSSCVHLFSKSALFRCSLSNAPLASPKRALKLSSSGRTSYKNLFLLNIFAIHLFHYLPWRIGQCVNYLPGADLEFFSAHPLSLKACCQDYATLLQGHSLCPLSSTSLCLSFWPCKTLLKPISIIIFFCFVLFRPHETSIVTVVCTYLSFKSSFSWSNPSAPTFNWL